MSLNICSTLQINTYNTTCFCYAVLNTPNSNKGQSEIWRITCMEGGKCSLSPTPTQFPTDFKRSTVCRTPTASHSSPRAPVRVQVLVLAWVWLLAAGLMCLVPLLAVKSLVLKSLALAAPVLLPVQEGSMQRQLLAKS